MVSVWVARRPFTESAGDSMWAGLVIEDGFHALQGIQLEAKPWEEGQENHWLSCKFCGRKATIWKLSKSRERDEEALIYKHSDTSKQ